MIVIATYKNDDVAERCLISIRKYSSEQAVIIDTSGERKKELTDRFNIFKVLVDSTPFANYDTGAYIYAYHNYYDNADCVKEFKKM